MGMKKIISIKKDEPQEAGNKGVSFKKLDKTEKKEKSGVELTQDIVYASLKEVYDPEIPVSIVDLGLIYDVIISSGSNICMPLRTSISATSWGVVTITPPVSGAVWTSESCASPVPGGRSITR